jgi:PAS domain S-box-containing protein
MPSPQLSVRRKLATLLTVLVGLPLVAAGLGGVLATQAYLGRQAHLTLATELAHLDEQVRNLYATLRTDAAVARAFLRTADRGRLDLQLHTFAAARPPYGTVSLLGAEGQMLAHVDRPPWTSSESPYYAAVAEGLPPDSVAVLPVELAAGGNKVRPTLAAITRLGPSGGRPLRAVVLEMDADTLFGIFRSASGPLGGTLGVVFGDGYFLYRSQGGGEGAGQALRSTDSSGTLAAEFPEEHARTILSGRSGELSLGDRIVFFRSVGPLTPQAEYRLIAYREVSRRELLAPARRLGLLMGGGLVLMLALALASANLTARNFTRPILLLRDATRRVAQGIWEPLAVKTNDELEELARDFSVMADEVRTRRASLETLVAELTSAKETLRRSEAGYRSLVESAPYGICRVTLDGRFRDVNPALVAILRRASAADVLALDLGRDVFTSEAAWAEVVAEFRHKGRIDGKELEWRRADGQAVFVRASGRRLPDHPEEPDSVELIAEDITERRGLEFRLRQAQKMDAVGQLAGGMAHDFNNLLTTILASAEMLRADLPPGATESEDLQGIRQAAERGAALIRKLMAFTRQEALAFQTVHLRELVAEFARILRRIVRENVTIELITDPAEPAVRADRSALEQILLNLVTNARDAMPSGGTVRLRTGHATVDERFTAQHGWGTPGEYGVLQVTDTGQGMDAETQRRVFEPFFTTKAVDAGTGLGLAIVYGLVKQHAGYIDIESQPAVGTAVTVYLPAMLERRVPAAAAPAGAPLPRGVETILLVEDEPSLRSTGKRALEKHGYAVLLACDGVEAFELLRANDRKIDLVVSDVVMPRMGGPQLQAQLREAGYTVKILFTSGYTDRDVRDAIRLEPSVPFLPKPWTIAELLRRVRDLLDS